MDARQLVDLEPVADGDGAESGPADSPWPTPLLAGLAGLAGLLGFAYMAAPAGAWARGLHLGASSTVAVALMAVLVRRGRPWSGPWMYTGAAVVLWAAGDWVWSRHDWSELQSPPAPSPADVLYLAARAALAAALVALIRRREHRPDLDRRLDTLAVALIAALAAWELAVRPMLVQPGLASTGRLLLSGYAAVDVALLVLLAWLVITHRRVTVAAASLVVGVVAWLGADLAFLITLDQGGYAFGSSRAVDAPWLAGLVLVAFATAHPSRRELATPPPRLAPQTRSTRIVLAVAALLVPTGTTVLSTVADGERLPMATLLATAALAVLVAMRLLRLDRARDQLESQLRRSEDHYRALAANSSDAVLVVDGNGRITNESPALAAFVGLAGARTSGSSVFAAIAAEDQAEARATFARALRQPGRVHSLELRVEHLDGSILWVAVRFVNLLDDPAVGGVVANVHDVTARKEAEAAIEYQAFHDPLTGLANRPRFRQRVAEALREAQADPARAPAILFIDLDRFKGVNDTMGHEAGDELLRVVAARVRSSVRPHDVVARLGGDEFAVLIAAGGDVEAEAGAVAEGVLGALSAPVSVAGRSLAVGASVGVAVAGPGATPSSLLGDADIAMYAAKAAGRGRWTLFDVPMRAVAIERLRLEDDLWGAPDRGELQLAYQPIVDLPTGRVRGFEALVRWDHPTLGTLTPDRFIPGAEETGAIAVVARWVLQTACRTAATWQREFPRNPGLTISVNLSPRQLLDEQLPADVRAAVLSTGLDPSALVLEVAEAALVGVGGDVVGRLAELRELGVRLAVDGFGTGYSSLGYLRQLQVDILKLDRSVVNAISGGEAVPDVVRGLLDLGRGLGLELVAAGIEQEGQLATLRREGGVAGQGFLFARPLSEIDAEALLIEPAGAWKEQRSERG